MLSYGELKESIREPENYCKLPTAKYLRNFCKVLVDRRLDSDAELIVYQNGYAMYRIGAHSTVFSVNSCGDYVYESPAGLSYIRNEYFDGQAWYVRLVLEGEDRLLKNCIAWENGKCVPYNAYSNEWSVLADSQEPLIETLIKREDVQELMNPLTEKQRRIIYRHYVGGETRKEIAGSLGISQEAVRRTLDRAIKNMKKKYSTESYNAKGVVSHAG